MDIPDDAEIVYTSVSTPGHHVLESLLEAGVPVTQIVSITPEMGREAGVAKYTDFAAIAEEYDIPIYYPEIYSMDESDVNFFEELDGDLMIVNGWNRIIPGEVLDTFSHGVLGNHGSAFGLPKGRGRSPLNWSLIEELDRFLLSIIRLDANVDAGAVAATRKFDINQFGAVRPFSADFAHDAAPGEIIAAFHTDEFVVSTPDGSVLVTEWEADGWQPAAGMVFESEGDHTRVDGIEQKQHLTTNDD